MKLFLKVSAVFFAALLFTEALSPETTADQPKGEEPLKVGVATILSGDFAVLGQNISRSVETYRRHYLRHPMLFLFEDAKKGSVDGLRAYQHLINIEHVEVLIGGTTSNGTIAAKRLINSSGVPLLTPLTGGSNIDAAGPFIFRIGNSDILNGRQQADLFIERGLFKTALLAEQTEYTTDIAIAFRRRYQELGGRLVFDQEFSPNETDFRTIAVRIGATKPDALFVSTQTGLAFGLFVKQLHELKSAATVEIHTNFVAATNPDAREAAGNLLNGVYYLAPAYDRSNPKLKEFFDYYRSDHGEDPAIGFHAAGVFDSLSLLETFLDQSRNRFSREGFQQWLLSNVKDYHGLMGTYSFDSEGNSGLGFGPEVIAAQ